MRSSDGIRLAAAVICLSFAPCALADEFDPSPWARNAAAPSQRVYPFKASAFSKVGKIQNSLSVYAGGDDRELLAAAARNDLPMIEKLVRSGANPNAKDEGGMRPLTFALNFGSVEAVRVLLDAGADPELKNEGCTLLATAAMQGHSRIAGLLLDAGARVDERCDSEYTALMNAAFMNHAGTVETLLRHHPNLSLENAEGRTALLIAREQGHAGIVDLLLGHGASPHAVGGNKKPVRYRETKSFEPARWTFQD